MGFLKVNRTATVTIAVLLGGCAAVAPAKKDATIFSPRTNVSDKAVPRDRKKAEVEPSLDLEGAVRQAQAERKAGDLAAATHTLSQLVLVAPDDPRVLGEYGKTLVVQGRSDDALAFLERAVELQPSDWSLFSAQGVAFDQKGQYLQAQAAYSRALTLKPGEPGVLSNSALSHIQSGDLDTAERLLKEAAVTGSDNPRIASNLALVRSLKSSRSNAAAPVAPNAAIQASPPLAESLAEMDAPATQTDQETSGGAIASSPVDSAPLDAPQPAVAAAPSGPNPSSNALPTVVMQKVPVDPLAGRVAPKRIAAAKKPAAPKKQEAEPDASPLRPALDDQQANASE